MYLEIKRCLTSQCYISLLCLETLDINARRFRMHGRNDENSSQCDIRNIVKIVASKGTRGSEGRDSHIAMNVALAVDDSFLAVLTPIAHRFSVLRIT